MRALVFTLSLAVLSCTSSQQGGEDPLPRFAEADALRTARSLELVTLDPEGALALPRAPRFDDYRVMGRATLEDPAERDALIAALDAAIERADTRETKCEFVPHHGLHAEADTGDIDVAICFTCGEAWVYRAGERRTHYRIAMGRNPAIEALVDRHELARAAGAP